MSGDVRELQSRLKELSDALANEAVLYKQKVAFRLVQKKKELGKLSQKMKRPGPKSKGLRGQMRALED